MVFHLLDKLTAFGGIHPEEKPGVHMSARPSVARKLAYAKSSYGLRAPLVSFVEAVSSDLTKLTSCQRCGSGSLDHTSIPFRTTPFVRIQKIAPSSAF